ncbi:MAG TPA: putative toxin-antitoxin system toxin component, PIN family [Candidatus Thermoplasmatota archaeon]|jgi:putative PIN family toxin of toxin-antitoxin system|nr:putative toxin-antitoxin system toxin component, PIN family [Candidatus Thermoplasmatota archaeon]
MLRTVADANVLISAFIASGPPHRFFRHCLARRVTLIVSPPMLEELTGVLRRPKFKLSPAEVSGVVQIVAEAAEIVEARERHGIVPDDPDDDVIMSAAIDGRAAYIVTGDKALLDLSTYEGIDIMPVAKFLREILKES